MPTYDFRCPNGHQFERFFRNMSDAPLAVPCEKCEAVAERRVSGGAGLVFKGSGFYLTDYGKNAHRGTPPPSASGSKSEGGEGAKESTGSREDGKSTTPQKTESSSESGGGSSSSTPSTPAPPKSE
jgi:putative FmdB family regulatory protein